jgi:hypothetical protein
VEGETLRERVGRLETAIPEIYRQLGVMDIRTGHIEISADDVKRSIYGYDTEAGILHLVKVLESKMDDIWKLMWLILGVVAAIAIGGLYEVVIHVVTAVK